MKKLRAQVIRYAKKLNITNLSTLRSGNVSVRAKEKNITEAYFDRGQHKYHGRIKSFADTLRKNGLKF